MLVEHEGVSRLFEMDWDIPRVSSVSGHRDWNSLRRYTHLRGQGDGYKGWKWLDQIIQAPVKIGARVGTRVGNGATSVQRLLVIGIGFGSIAVSRERLLSTHCRHSRKGVLQTEASDRHSCWLWLDSTLQIHCNEMRLRDEPRNQPWARRHPVPGGQPPCLGFHSGGLVSGLLYILVS